MIFQILVLMLILAIIFYQIVQGLYSATIMMIIAVLTSAIAFNYYQALASSVGCDMGVAVIMLFCLPMLALRIAADYFLKSNVVFNRWIDRIGGGMVGFVTAMICTGTLVCATYLMPWGTSILGFSTHDENLNPRHLWLKPDEFVLKINSMWSDGSLSGDNSWTISHSDFRLDNYCLQNDAGLGRRPVAQDDALDGMKLKTHSDAGVYMFENWEAFCRYKKVAKDPGTKPARPVTLDEAEYNNARVLVVRVKVNQTARDDDGNFRLPATHFKLIAADNKGNRSGHYPLAYLTFATRPVKLENVKTYDDYIRSFSSTGEWKLATDSALAKLAVRRPWFEKGGPDHLTIDWVFLIPKNNLPKQMVYRNLAIANLNTGENGIRKSLLPTTPKIYIRDPKTKSIIQTIVPLERAKAKAE